MINMKLNGLNAYFYKSENGNEPVRDWIKSLSKEDKKVLGEDIKTVQIAWPIGMPLVRSLGGGLWEIRSDLFRNRISRIIFFMYGNSMVLLHGFIKKTQKASQSDIDLARKRMREVKNIWLVKTST
ncbi:MAG: type II toxin-antitoxin system RelE/ParE family toxin [Proteobacteria bacterium]|nr:type II toxin-antitoxin system RelE/ParE family toxin [Pseudomonadota bacterium]